MRWVFDVIVAWSLTGDPITAHLASSVAAAKRKWSDYNGALARCIDHVNTERAACSTAEGRPPLQLGSHFVEAYHFVLFAA